MKQLETLLTSLVQRGRKPWGLRYFAEVMVFKTYIDFITKKWASSPTSLRELVSLESWLWQFVCERQLWGNERGYWLRCHSHPLDYEADYSWKFNYEFRLLESALIPEEELGKFLVENIVVEWLKSEQSKK